MFPVKFLESLSLFLLPPDNLVSLEAVVQQKVCERMVEMRPEANETMRFIRVTELPESKVF